MAVQQGAVGDSSYPSMYQLIRGTTIAIASTEIPLFLNGPRDLYLDDLSIRYETGNDGGTADLYYAVDGADMDSSDTTGNTALSDTGSSISTDDATDGTKAGKIQTFTLSDGTNTGGRVRIPANALVWMECSVALSDEVTFLARAQEI